MIVLTLVCWWMKKGMPNKFFSWSFYIVFLTILSSYRQFYCVLQSRVEFLDTHFIHLIQFIYAPYVTITSFFNLAFLLLWLKGLPNSAEVALLYMSLTRKNKNEYLNFMIPHWISGTFELAPRQKNNESFADSQSFEISVFTKIAFYSQGALPWNLFQVILVFFSRVCRLQCHWVKRGSVLWTRCWGSNLELARNVRRN